MPAMTPKAAAAPKIPPPAPAAPAPKRRPRISRGDAAERRFPVIYRRLEKEYPDAKCALNFSNPHEMLFATIVSAQCTDVMVNKATAKLFPKYPNLEDYANVASGGTRSPRGARSDGREDRQCREHPLLGRGVCGDLENPESGGSTGPSPRPGTETPSLCHNANAAPARASSMLPPAARWILPACP